MVENRVYFSNSRLQVIKNPKNDLKIFYSFTMYEDSNTLAFLASSAPQFFFHDEVVQQANKDFIAFINTLVQGGNVTIKNESTMAIPKLRGLLVAGDLTMEHFDGRFFTPNELGNFETYYGLKGCEANCKLRLRVFEGFGNHDFFNWSEPDSNSLRIYYKSFGLIGKSQQPVIDRVKYRNTKRFLYYYSFFKID
jgi:hypothetical protein